MLVWIIYDISDDKARKEISDTCKEFGLIRVQYSVFFGNLPKTCVDEIAVYSEKMIDKETDGVFILPVSEDDFRKKKIIGKTFDEAFATGQKTTMLL